MKPRQLLTLAAAFAFAMTALAAEIAPEGKDAKAAPADAALKATLKANKDSYKLDPAQAGKAFRDKLVQAKKKGDRVPAEAPAIDFTLTVTNTSKEDVTIRIGGDESRIELKLEGPGAVTIPNLVAMTMDFRQGAEVTLAPGKTHELAISSLMFGARGISEAAYFTEPGEYKLTATLVAAQGEGQVTLTSNAVTFKVTKE